MRLYASAAGSQRAWLIHAPWFLTRRSPFSTGHSVPPALLHVPASVFAKAALPRGS